MSSAAYYIMLSDVDGCNLSVSSCFCCTTNTKQEQQCDLRLPSGPARSRQPASPAVLRSVHARHRQKLSKCPSSLAASHVLTALTHTHTHTHSLPSFLAADHNWHTPYPCLCFLLPAASNNVDLKTPSWVFQDTVTPSYTPTREARPSTKSSGGNSAPAASRSNGVPFFGRLLKGAGLRQTPQETHIAA